MEKTAAKETASTTTLKRYLDAEKIVTQRSVNKRRNCFLARNKKPSILVSGCNAIKDI